ncbi:MAG: aspartate/glutamate racemase family protein, partial [Vicinamibacterales bacterium]
MTERSALAKALSLYSEYGARGRIGLIAPSTNTTLEPEFWRMAPDGIAIHVARVHQAGPQGDPASYQRMADGVDHAAMLLATAEIDVVAFGCTSCTYFVPAETIRSAIVKRTDCPAILTAEAVLAAMAMLGVRRVAVAGPRTRPVTDLEVAFLADAGLQVVSTECLGLGATEEERRYIGRVPAEVAARLASRADRPEAEAVFVSCTQLPTLGVVARLEAELGKPVITSNQATFWQALRATGY